MKNTLSTVCLVMLLYVNVAWAESNQKKKVVSPEKRALITEYFTVLKADVFTRNILNQKMSQLKKSGLKLDSSVEQELIEQLSNMNALLRIYGPVYAKHLTANELSTTLIFLN